MLDALGASGNGYEEKFDTTIPSPTFGYDTPPVYGGGTVKGYAGFLIDKNETSLMMRVKLFLENGEIFFKISN